jgi:hypothetical protein
MGVAYCLPLLALFALCETFLCCQGLVRAWLAPRPHQVRLEKTKDDRTKGERDPNKTLLSPVDGSY